MLLTRHKIPQRELAIDNIIHSDYEPEIFCPLAFDCRDGVVKCPGPKAHRCQYCKDTVPRCYYNIEQKLCFNCL